MVVIIIGLLFIFLGLFEKTDYEESRKADKLPSFNKQDAETYYTQTFNP